MMDKLFRKQLKRYINYIITYCEQDAIFGVPCIKLRNGVNVNGIPIIPKKESENKTLQLLAMANISIWHGFERLIYGLDAYVKDKRNTIHVHLTIIGTGKHLPQLKKIVDSLSLNSHITFKDFLTGQHLTDEINKADVGISTLGMHLKNVTQDSSFKSREYCARGLPFILSCDDKDFPPHLPFINYHPNTHEPIDITKIISFYNTLKQQYPDYIHMMRDYAEKQLTWEVKLKPIIEKLGL
jgi:hypothetical protein